MSRFANKFKRPIARAILGLWIAVTLLAVVTNVRAWADDPKPDPGGATTGAAADVKDAGGTMFIPPAPADSDDAKTKADKQKALDAYNTQAKAEPLAVRLADAIGQTQIATNIVWTLITGFLVMFMQAGFAMVETGFCRAKNAAHVIMTNFMIYPLGMLGFWIAGFAIMFGSVANTGVNGIGGPGSLGGLGVLNGNEISIFGFGIAGTKGFFLGPSVYDVGVFTMFLFQMVFMDTTATIPTGAMAERWRFSAFMIYGFFVSIIAYPIYGHMMWGNGGLATLGLKHGLGHGAVDFAGSSVVHAVGGFVALAGAYVLGPRIGKYNKDGTPNAIPGHHIPMAIIGTFILAFGWFGFNPGSTLGAVGAGNMRIAVIATNTMLASAGGALSAILYMKARFGKYDPSMAANGMLAGLVAITAPCAFVNAWSAVVIGLIAGVIVCLSVFFWERVHIDDPVGAVSVHGVCGIWGLLSVGIFADGTFGAGWQGVGASDYLGKAGQGVTGLLYGDHTQIFAQLIAACVCMAWSFGSMFVFLKLQSMVMKIRPSAEEEMAGLDLPEMGALAYPDFQQLDATSPGLGRAPSAAAVVNTPAGMPLEQS
jgi:Amt family ammonium transporter